MESYDLFASLNHTEAYQLARRAGHAVTPALSREDLLRVLTDEVDPATLGQMPHELDEWRYALMGFIIEHRRRLESQLTCPAKSMDPRACFTCVDAQLVWCLNENKKHLHLIQLHRRPQERT